MPIKNLTTPYARDGMAQRAYKFGGGANTITTEDGYFDELGIFVPYSIGYNIKARGGDDNVTGSINNDTLIGGTGDDTIFGGDGSDEIRGGKLDNDEGRRAETTHNRLYGETEIDTITTDGTGDGDMIYGGDGAGGVGFPGGGNEIWGDYGTLTVDTDVTHTGGGDMIYGGDAANGVAADNDMVGDAGSLILRAGTDGTETGTTTTYTGGIDTIHGGAGSVNTLYGDVTTVSLNTNTSFTGGDDILISGTNATDTMYGDAANIFNQTPGGTFTGGDDTFVFAPNNGNDTIMDFELAEIVLDEFGDPVLDPVTGQPVIDPNDIVDLTDFDPSLGFDNLVWSNGGDGTGNTITFSAGNTLTFIGLVQDDFVAEDFLFA